MDNYITKSKYVDFCKCPRSYYLKINNKELMGEPSDFSKHLAENGIVVGSIARDYFGPSITITHSSNIEMANKTKEAIKNGHKVICEASFIYKDLFCSIDLFKINDDGTVEIYEVKSTTSSNETYMWDTSFQYYVLEKLNYKINKIKLLIVNNKYIYKDKLDIKSYFKEEDVDLQTNIDDNLKIIRNLDKLPNIIANKYCSSGTVKCPFFNYCFDASKDNSIFKIAGLNKQKYYNKGIKTFEDFYAAYPELKEKQKPNKKDPNKKSKLDKAYEQVDYYLNDKGLKLDKEKVQEFLDKLEYPLYYLDFETIRDIKPFINGTYPYFERVFQFSLHIQQSKYGECKHEEYIQEYKEDNLKEVAKELVEKLGNKGSIIVYHQGEEKGRIKELAEFVPEYKKDLLAISKRIKDLEYPFKDRYIYLKGFKGKSSIKNVLPAFVPECEDSYKSLPSVHNGTEAIAGYEKLVDKNYLEHDKLKEDMLAYCCLDTMAMVKVLEKIYKLMDE